MSTRDQSIDADVIHRMHNEICQQGSKWSLNDLAEEEPALAAYVIFAGATIADTVRKHVPASLAAAVEQEVVGRMLSAIKSVRHAHYELWRDVWPNTTLSDEKEIDGE